MSRNRMALPVVIGAGIVLTALVVGMATAAPESPAGRSRMHPGHGPLPPPWVPWPVAGPPIFLGPGPYRFFYPIVTGIPQPLPPLTPRLATPGAPMPWFGFSVFASGSASALPPWMAPAPVAPWNPASVAGNQGFRPMDRAVRRVSRSDRERAAERVKVGDRLFRVKDFHRAAERYKQAIGADPSDAKPYVRLAQLDVARGRYEQAARRLREAQTAQPNWQSRADDVQNLFGDPDEFAHTLNRLESHLQTHPDDRDAWLVLGAELFLTGRSERANDIFLRLTDQKPDATLAGFLQAPPLP